MSSPFRSHLTGRARKARLARLSRPTSLVAAVAALGGLTAIAAAPAVSWSDDDGHDAAPAAAVVNQTIGDLVAEVGTDPINPVVLLDAEEADEPLVFEGADGEVVDADRLRVWLEDRDSPMAEHAEDLVRAGLEHDVDPRLVVGIAAIESSAGKRLPPGSHNAWGWNGDGPHGLKAWPSWPAAIDGFTEGLARVYDTDNVDERMARKYVPPNWQKWLRTVRWVMEDI